MAEVSSHCVEFREREIRRTESIENARRTLWCRAQMKMAARSLERRQRVPAP